MRRSRPVLLTDFVLLEVANMYSASPRHEEVAAFILALRSDSAITIVPATRDLFDRGLALLSNSSATLIASARHRMTHSPSRMPPHARIAAAATYNGEQAVFSLRR